MQTEIRAVLEKTRVLAEQRGWSRVAEVAATLGDGNGVAVVIASPAALESAHFVDWAKNALPQSEVKTIELEGLAGNPAEAFKADKLVAIFECGKVIEADAADALSAAFFGRPSSSYAIVLVGAELVDTPDELEVAQRAAWRVLVPDPKPEWGGQDLLRQNCFLWSEVDPKDFLQLRVERDKTALQKWLQFPSAANSAILERDAALYVLELAEAEAHRADESSSLAMTEDSALETRQMNNTLESLSNTRRHLVRRLDADAASLERQLIASLQTLEQDMLHDLPAHLRRQAQLNKGTDVRQVLGDYISGRISQWQSSTRTLLSTRGREISGEVEDMFGSIDWELVNRLASRQGHIGYYPQTIVDEVMKHGSPHTTLPNWLDGGAEANPQEASSGIMRKALGAAMIVGVGAVLLGAGGIIAGTVAAVVGVRKMHRMDDERRAEAYGRTVIRDVIGRAINHVRDMSRTTIGPTRDAINKELRVIEDLLERALAHSRNASAQSDAITLRSPDLNTLDELRLQVLSAAPEQGTTTFPSMRAE